MKIIKIRNGKVKLGRHKDQKKCKSQKIYRLENVWVGQIQKSSENGHNLEIGLGFCR